MLYQGLNMLCCLTMMLNTAAFASDQEFRVPLIPQPPKLDGMIDPEEWRDSVGFDGFGWEGQLERRHIRAFVGATEEYFCFAFLSQLPEEGQLLAQVQNDTLKVVYDDSIEVWIDPTPGLEHGKTFHMVANSLGKRGYKMHARGNVQDEPDWQGNWQVANGFHDNYWHCEVLVPIREMEQNRKIDEGVWGINLCRNWKQPWAFSSLGERGYAPENLRFIISRDNTPAIAHEQRSDQFIGDIDSVIILGNPSSKPISVKTDVLLNRDMMPEIHQRETLPMSPGEYRELKMQLKDEASRKFGLSINITSEDEKEVYYSRSVNWKADQPWQWKVAKQEQLPVDIQFAYYPYGNKMRIMADVTGLPADAALEYLNVQIRDKEVKKAVKTVKFDSFAGGKQEQTFQLPELEGKYEIVASAVGENVPKDELIKEFERTRYPWERNQMGKSENVYIPFTPLKVDGKKVSSVLREHEMNDSGLWDQVVAKDKAILAAPIEFHVVIEGQEAPIKAEPLKFLEKAENKAVFESAFQTGNISAKAKSTWDYDGMMLVELSLMPTGESVDELYLEIPFANEAATLMHAIGDGIRNTIYQRIPEGEGTVWTSQKVQASDIPKNFCSYIYVGTPVRGLCWFAENDLNWGWDDSKPNVELIRKGDVLILKVNFINRLTTIGEERKITFGLLAAPVKPRLGNWRHAYWRDNYTLLGTDINWFALGDCGSVYPAGRDLYLWEMIRRGNEERLSDEEINQVIQKTRKYFEPYGENRVENFERHVRYNLRSRYGKKMIFYYNRASYQDADEFQTFQDEWGLTDYRTVGPGNGIGEIKIVPSESYIDHALYWYDKSFDIGGNQGVYWDNWFFVGSYNTEMTRAYRQPDGSIIPSTGIWGLRMLSKRTFQLMNERGMMPITMPHMTSANILPLHSFATVQYDWEWKYSEGDVQYRFPREYILLVSNGELAGTWPVLLGDHGPLADDPWTQRTFAAVCLVHELTPSGGMAKVWDPLLKPILDMLDDKGLEVYRYWDERPQPVTTDNPDLLTIVYSIPGEGAVFVVTSYAEKDAEANIWIDAKALGLEKGYKLVDVETGEEIKVENDGFSFVLKKHDVREFRISGVKN